MSVKLREKALSDGRTSLYLDVYHERRRSYEFLNLYLTRENKGGHNRETRQLAERLRAKREYELSEGTHGYAPDRMCDADFLAYFDKLADRRKPSTRAVWLITKMHLKRYAGAPIPFGNLTRQWMMGWRAYLLGAMAQNSARLHFNTVKTALRTAVADEILSKNPATQCEGIPAIETQRAYLSEEELARLVKTPCRHPVIKQAFLFACAAGLRISDVRALRWGMIRDGRIEYRQKKTGAPEYLPLGEAARAFLPPEGAPDAAVFDLWMSKVTVRNTLTAWAAAAEVKKHVTFHVSRHTFATMLLTLGAEIYTVSKLLGHRSLATTQVYAKIVDEKKQAALDLLPVHTMPKGA